MSRAAPTLIDSSVWIEMMRGTAPVELRQRLEGLLASGQTAMCPPVWLELYQGARSRREVEFVTRLRSVSRWASLTDEGWEQAASLAQKAVKDGLTCPLADILIVVCARQQGWALLHRDKHMDGLDRKSVV